MKMQMRMIYETLPYAKKKVIKKEINTNDLKRKYYSKEKKEVNNYQPEQNSNRFKSLKKLNYYLRLFFFSISEHWPSCKEYDSSKIMLKKLFLFIIPFGIFAYGKFIFFLTGRNDKTKKIQCCSIVYMPTICKIILTFCWKTNSGFSSKHDTRNNSIMFKNY